MSTVPTDRDLAELAAVKKLLRFVGAMLVIIAISVAASISREAAWFVAFASIFIGYVAATH